MLHNEQLFTSDSLLAMTDDFSLGASAYEEDCTSHPSLSRCRSFSEYNECSDYEYRLPELSPALHDESGPVVATPPLMMWLPMPFFQGHQTEQWLGAAEPSDCLLSPCQRGVDRAVHKVQKNARQGKCSNRTQPPWKRSRVAARSHQDDVEFSFQLLVSLEVAGETRKGALASLRGNVERLAFHERGCRAVQRAIEVADKQQAVELVSELCGHAVRAAFSENANFVLQKAIVTLPAVHFEFIAAELSRCSLAVAKHRCACRILCRLLEHSANEANTIALVDEVLQHAGDLSRHNFGHHVIGSAVVHGLNRQRERIVNVFANDLARLVKSRNAQFVLEQILSPCSEDELCLISSAVTAAEGDAEVRERLAQSQVGANISLRLAAYAAEKAQLAPVDP